MIGCGPLANGDYVVKHHFSKIDNVIDGDVKERIKFKNRPIVVGYNNLHPTSLERVTRLSLPGEEINIIQQDGGVQG